MFEKIINFFQGLGLVHDATENIRPTTTDIKDTEDGLKKYEYKPDDDEKIPTSRAEYKARKKQNIRREEER